MGIERISDDPIEEEERDEADNLLRRSVGMPLSQRSLEIFDQQRREFADFKAVQEARKPLFSEKIVDVLQKLLDTSIVTSKSVLEAQIRNSLSPFGFSDIYNQSKQFQVVIDDNLEGFEITLTDGTRTETRQFKMEDLEDDGNGSNGDH